MTVKEFTDMLSSFNSIVICVEKKGTVIAFDEISKYPDGDCDIEVNLKLANTKGYSADEIYVKIAEINAMEVTEVTTAVDAFAVRLWLDV